MPSSPSVGEQLAEMLGVLRRTDQNSVWANQSGDITFMSLVWPLLPVLPPQPPQILTELLGEPESDTKDKCDVCGTVGKTFTTCRSAKISPAGAGLRHRTLVEQTRSSIDRMMEYIEQKVDETLNNIEGTTLRTTELNTQTKELYESGKSLLTDKELLNRLKTLMKQKETQEKRVQALETQEQQLKDSLITAIKWVKDIKPKDQQLSSGVDAKQDKNVKRSSSQEQTLEEDIFNESIINLVQATLNGITENQNNIQIENKNNVNDQTEITQELQEFKIKEMTEKLSSSDMKAIVSELINHLNLTRININDENHYSESTLRQSQKKSN